MVIAMYYHIFPPASGRPDRTGGSPDCPGFRAITALALIRPFMDAKAAISLTGVTKTFGQTVAVRGLDLVVPRGALYGFIGPNGAGKTTSIRMIMSILFPDAGTLSVLGRASALDAKDRIGYLPEERGVYRKMRVGAFLPTSPA